MAPKRKQTNASNGEVPVIPKKPKVAPVRKKRAVPKNNTKKLKLEPTLLECIPRHDRGSGLVLTLGQGDTGQLGLGEEYLERYRPARVNAVDKKVADVCAGGMHTALLTEDGEVFTFGCNDEGALGRETDGDVDGDSPEFVPGKVEIPGKIVQISAGDSHTAALSDDGSVYLWGNFRDSNGAIGLISEKQRQKRPIRILPLIKIAKIASGADHLALLSTDGHLYTCGCAEQGQLGRVAEFLSNGGGRKGLGLLLTPQQVNVAKMKKSVKVQFDDVWAGSYATFARCRTTGDIYACGLNNYNQIGFANQEAVYNLQAVPSFANKKWEKITAGMHHTLSLDDNGTVYALGRKEYGRLGLGEDCEDATYPVSVPTLAKVKCVDVSCGTTVSYAVTKGGNLYAWGMGTSGQLGRGTDEEDAWVPNQMAGKELEKREVLAVSSGGQHTVILAKEAE